MRPGAPRTECSGVCRVAPEVPDAVGARRPAARGQRHARSRLRRPSLCDAYGGAINRIAPTATAFVDRQPPFCIQWYYGNGSTSAWIHQEPTKLGPYVSGAAYQNYIDSSLEDWQQAYCGQNLQRLEATRKGVDPQHYFNSPQAIGR
jgi:berberine-like enzyme